MRALVWIVEDTWETAVAGAATHLPADAEVTLIHVAPADVEEIAGGARHGLLGRRGPRPPRRGPGARGPHAEHGHPPPPPHHEPLRDIGDEEAAALLDEARAALGRPAELVRRRGRVEREVVAAAANVDLLVAARDGDRDEAGPHSLAPHTRYVVDHATCAVLLVWPDEPEPAS